MVVLALSAGVLGLPISGAPPAHAATITVNTTADELSAITSPDPAGNVHIITSLALDASGNPVVAYQDGVNQDLKLLHCGNATCTAGNTIASPDTVGAVGIFASLALDTLGNPVVSYKAGSALKVLHCGNPTCTAGNTTATPDTFADTGFYTSLALDASGNPVVSYLVGSAISDLKVLHCGNPTCTAGNTIASPDTAGDVGTETSLALDGSGNPVVSYYDTTNQDLKVLHCNDPNCVGGDESITSPDTAGNVGREPSLALDGSGNPVVSYYDATNQDLKVLHCNDPNCAGGDASITSPDMAVGLVGGPADHNGISLALDASGSPVVAYHDETGGDLQVLHCNDANCAGGDESITTPDVGGCASLALDASGKPVVSYCDVVGPVLGPLKLLHCNDPNCASTDGDCSLREAIQAANTDTAVDACLAGSGADTIVLPAGTYTLSIAGANENANATGDLDITSDLTITGAGVATTIIDAGGLDRVLHVVTGTVGISGVTIQNGAANPTGGGILSASGSTMIVNSSIVSGNAACCTGGGISNSGTMTLTNSTVSGNTASGGWGGGILNNTFPSTLTTVTVSGNTAYEGGGIVNAGALTINSSTISGNSAVVSGGGIDNSTVAGVGTATLKNTIVGNNTGSNCDVAMTSAGHNLSSDKSCGFTATGDLQNTNAMLGPLADNGGPTQTHALLPGSPAIDAGDNVGCPATDQRGFPRPVDGDRNGTATCDIGAYELSDAIDTDLDGCIDAEENGPNQGQGGRRNYFNFWDFFDVPVGSSFTRDRIVDIGDILAIVLRFAQNDEGGTAAVNRNTPPLSTPPPPGLPKPGSYHPAYDRGGPIPGQNAWNQLPANGVIDIGDILAAVLQFGHNCLGPP